LLSCFANRWLTGHVHISISSLDFLQTDAQSKLCYCSSAEIKSIAIRQQRKSKELEVVVKF